MFNFITFIIVDFAWIFFRTNSFADAKYIVKNLIDFSKPKSFYNLGLPKHEFKLAIISILLLVVFDLIHRKHNAFKLLNKMPMFIRSFVYIIIAFSLFIFGVYGEGSVSEFIYFQF